MSIETKNVAVGSLADMTSLNWHVCFTPIADIRDEGRNVCFVQIPKVLDLVVEGCARSIVRAFIRKDIAPIQWFRSGKNQIFVRK